MIVTIHQPEHLPWLGFFHKMSQADLYVVLDTVQFEKNNWQNRNKLVDRNGQVFWATVPVNLKGHLSSTINDISIENEQPWQRKYWGRIQDAYCRHPFFGVYGKKLEEIIKQPHNKLIDLNLALIQFIKEELKIKTRLVRASSLDVSGKRSELLLDIVLKTKGTEYLSGPSGKDYLDLSLFQEKDIKVTFHEFKHPQYEAQHFVPFLSALDILMNVGDKGYEYLNGEIDSRV